MEVLRRTERFGCAHRERRVVGEQAVGGREEVACGHRVAGLLCVLGGAFELRTKRTRGLGDGCVRL